IDWIRERQRVAIGFSGGVDSSYLAAVAVESVGAANTLAIIGRSESLAGSEEDHAVAVAHELGVPVFEVSTGELADPRYAANPTNRCYFCKTVLWHTLLPLARARGFETLVDGTNADDLHDYRPGGLAAQEHGVASPLALVGLTKAEIRDRSRERGWGWWNRPSSPCLASRLPYGMSVTPERLRQVDHAESALRALGVTGNLRVRHHGELARVEIDRELLPQWISGTSLAAIVAAVSSAGFSRVEIDPRGFRSGGLNVLAHVAGHEHNERGATVSGH
ncbi:MAG TPA: ATP-dependent sacrificial sulfur transferase LarE, partial [Gemmatimonadaceae bacterium]|nr:ATP-dependent sacrificial sulfur transferase LarE [Gemmatimonadaceae bacterium]